MLRRVHWLVPTVFLLVALGCGGIDTSVQDQDRKAEAAAGEAVAYGSPQWLGKSGTDDSSGGAKTLYFLSCLGDSLNYSSDQVDWWALTVPSSQCGWVLKIAMKGNATACTTNGSGVDFDIYLYKDPQQAALDPKGNSSTANETINYTNACGTYYVKVYAYSGIGNYSISAEMIAPPVDKAKFISDGTYGDGYDLPPNTSFTKQWTIENSGNTTWNSNYYLKYVSGPMSTSTSNVYISGSVTPGAQYTFSVPMKTPATPGTYKDVWSFKNGSGTTIKVGSSETIWALIDVIAPKQPNLKPYTPSNWSAPIVPSNITGTTTTGTLSGCVPTYIDWAIDNNGEESASGTFYTDFYIDGTKVEGWTTNGLINGYYAHVDDWATTVNPGSHTLKLVTDATGVIAESSDSDNSYQQTFTWADCTPKAAIASPSSGASLGSSPITVTGSCSDDGGNLDYVKVTNTTNGSNGTDYGPSGGSSNFSVSGITLNPGSNAITATCYDTNGNTGSATVSVNLQTANLSPYTPSGWSGPITASSVPGTTTNGSLYSCRPTYIDWAVENNGGASISGVFSTDLYIDGTKVNSWSTDGLLSGYYTYVTDWTKAIAAGAHTLKIVTDATGVIAESSDSDNSYQQTFTWAACGGISGYVTNSSTGAAISGATISVTGTESTTVGSNGSGYYSASPLIAGSYAVQASASGYTGASTQSVNLGAGETATVNFALQKILAPILDYSPGSINVTMDSGTIDGTQSIVVQNTGDATLTYQLTGIPTWTTIRRNGGANVAGLTMNLAPGAQDHLGVNFSSKGIIDSTSATVLISSNDSTHAGANVTLNMSINTPPSPLPKPEEQPAPKTPPFKPANYGMCPVQNACYAEPVNTALGNYVYEHGDIALRGRGPVLTFARTYNSIDASDGPLGVGWTHSMNIYLLESSSGDLSVRWGNGRTDLYTVTGDGTYTAPAGIFDTVTKGSQSFLLTDTDSTVWTFSLAGQLTSIKDPHNNQLTLSYDALSRLATVTNSMGESMQFVYADTASLHIASVTDPAGRAIQFAYTGNLLTDVTDARGNSFTYGYDAGKRLTEIRERDGGIVVKNTYDAGDRVVNQADGLGNITTFAYDTPSPGETTITSPAGKSEIHAHDALNRLTKTTAPTGETLSYLYNTSNLPTKVTDALGKNLTVSYDARGNITQLVEPSGATVGWTYDGTDRLTSLADPLGRQMEFQYNSAGDMTQITDASLGATIQSTFSYHPTGELATVTDAMGATTSLGIDGNANLTTVTDPLGGVTTFGYDAAHRITSRTDPMGHIWEFGYDANDNVTDITDPLNRTTTLTYDTRDRLTSVTAPGGAANYTYDAAGRVTKITTPASTTTYGYNSLNQLVTATSAGAKVTYAYTDLGLVGSVTDPTGRSVEFTRDAMGNVTAMKDPVGNTYTATHDAAGRVTSLKDPLWHDVAFAYNALGQLQQTTDPKGYVFKIVHDLLGRPTQAIDPLQATTQYAYDANSRLTGLTMPGGGAIAWKYDANGRLTQETSPSGSTRKFAYDGAGRVTTLTDADQKTTTFAYDAAGRVTSIAYGDGVTRSITYDNADRPLTVTENGWSRTYTYDAAGRVTNSTDPWGETIGYIYNAAGRVATLTYPGGKQVAYLYDAAGRLTSVTDWLGGTTSYDYDTGGRLAKTTYPNGTVTEQAYDAASHVTSLIHKKSDGTVFASQTLTVDERGDVTAADVTPSPTSWLPPAETAYVSNAEDQYTQIGSMTLEFDPVGQLVARSGAAPATYSFNVRNQLIAASLGGTVTTMTYGSEGERIEQSTPTKTTKYVVDTTSPLTNVLAELDASGVVTTQYVFGLGLLAQVPANNNIRYYHHDAQGNVVALTDSSGTVTDTYFYHPFGAVLATTGTTANPYQFAGALGIQQDGTGLLYMRSRYYDPLQGRFVAKDPIGISGGSNQYAYGFNNPLYYQDPNGQCPPCVAILAAAGAGTVWGLGSTLVGDVIHSATVGHVEFSDWKTYGANTVGGATGGVATLLTGGNVVVGAAVDGAVSNVGDNVVHGRPIDWGQTAFVSGLGALTAGTLNKVGTSFFKPQMIQGAGEAGEAMVRHIKGVEKLPKTALEVPGLGKRFVDVPVPMENLQIEVKNAKLNLAKQKPQFDKDIALSKMAPNPKEELWYNIGKNWMNPEKTKIIDYAGNNIALKPFLPYLSTAEKTILGVTKTLTQIMTPVISGGGNSPVVAPQSMGGGK